jgi:nucleotide-binding universal stress UspA family protein
MFPVDFSPACTGPARYVEALAGHYESEVYLLHVIDSSSLCRPDELLERREKELATFAASDLKHFTLTQRCVIGDPAEVIRSAAHAWRPGLIMMPTHGLGAFRRLIMGSVTAKTLRNVSCPVWTGVHAEAAPTLEKIHLRKILCAVDLNHRSQEVVNWAANFAREFGAELGIVHATPILPPEYYEAGTDQDLPWVLEDEARHEIELLQQGAAISGPIFVCSDQTTNAVNCAARTFEPDLLVLGRHYGTGVSGFLSQHAYSLMSDSPVPSISI